MISVISEGVIVTVVLTMVAVSCLGLGYVSLQSGDSERVFCAVMYDVAGVTHG